MASPTPDPPASDAKLRDSTSEREQKPEVNGHATSEEPKSTSEPPTVNGNGRTDNHPTENGAPKDVEMAEDETESKLPKDSSEGRDVKSTNVEKEKPESDSQPEQTDDSKSKADQPITSEDVDMADATPADDSTKAAEDKPKDDKPVRDKSADTPKEPKDIDMFEEPEKLNGTDNKVLPLSNDSAQPTSEVDLQPASLSQLAIESNEVEPVVPKPSVEVTMEDAPTADSSVTAKVAREREDDATDEPAPKRAKTEPKEETPLAAASVTAPKVGTAPAEAPTDPETTPLANLVLWDDPGFNSQVLTPFQRREFRKVLGRVKKTKSGGHFKDSVQKLWPVLWESYVAKIEKPTDLSDIDRTLRDTNGAFVTVGDFRKALLLMYNNTRDFNGHMHDVTNAAFYAIRGIWEDVVHIPQDEPVKAKPAPKQKPPRESRVGIHADVVRKQSAGPGTTSPSVATPVSKPPAPSRDTATAAAVDVRRASIATEGDRPKRTVRAPKPKDIDYSTKPSRKKLKPELQFSEEILSDLMHPKNKAINSWFMEAVDAEGLNIPHYYSIIKKPMDLGKVSRLLASGEITSLKEFDKTVRLIFDNCYAFNGSVDQGNAVSFVASQLENYYNKQIKTKDAWLAKHAKANAPPVASHGSDEDEDEDEDAEGEEAPASAGVDPSKEVRELEAKLREESEKLTDLFAADSPNPSLIEVQQGILKMVQEALLKAKQNLSEYRQKQDKPTKKASSKPSKPKPNSSVVRKPTGNVAHPKKSGGSKKAAPKKILTAADKDQIATAINDLENPHLDRAIDIIKRDTGQNENNDGELELDIDQLSNEALLKLWELCKRVLPGFGKDANAQVSSPEATRPPPVPKPSKSSSTSAKPKKNKPMSAREQEERIAQLRGLASLYTPGQDPADGQGVYQAPTPNAESSDESDSEEE
ncbi:hypothetical protein FZEAL_10663 [Fusarium zealandicum]|uniref:Bromodomain-containing factor 1 n=1 Tax=Fusarium zealandicum TaxID=1053134 RepID=A0A8H4TYF2_9HYPO|nr:hypothetical protein FZEAL_10663 [Fusarium zealandicum]